MSVTKLMSAAIVATFLSLFSVGTANASTQQQGVMPAANVPSILFQPPSVPKNLHGECFPLEMPEPMFIQNTDHSKELFTGAGGALGGVIGGFVGTLFGPGPGSMVGVAVGSGIGGMLGSILYDTFRRPAAPTIMAPQK
jgi:hypothetical protein